MKRQFISFTFYRLDPVFRRLPAEERSRAKEAFTDMVGNYRSGGKVMVYPYALIGVRGDVDFLLWRVTYQLESLQAMAADLFATPLGGYLSTPYSFLSMTKRSIYVDKINPEHEDARLSIVPAQSQYLFVYPFVKTRDWYRLNKSERQKLMDTHIAVGNRYPSVRLHTSYSFGLDDQEFVVAFETDHPEDFLDLVMDLREIEASRYTLRDTPIFTCIKRDLGEILAML
jgi:chlorite dismutase